jgi:hypothetical protein
LIFIVNIPQAAPNIFEIVNLTNAERRQEGLSPLDFSDLLTQAAQAHATDMAQNNYFSHTNLEGLQVSDRVTAVGYSYSRVGENIAYGFASPADTMNQWMNSAGHRQNILRSEYTEIGVGYAYSNTSKRKHIWVQVFGTPRVTTAPSKRNRKAVPRESNTSQLVWITSKDEAMAKASRFGKKVLLVAGRDDCGNTQYARRQLEGQTWKGLLQQQMVLWYSNIDYDNDYHSYAMGIKGNYILPLVAIIDPSTPNQYLERFTGKELKRLFSRLQQLLDNQ